MVGFIHPVWWHPPDDGRLGMVVAEAVVNNINNLPGWWSLIFSLQSGEPRPGGARPSPKRAEPSSFFSKQMIFLPRWRLWRPSIGKGRRELQVRVRPP